MSYDLAGNRVSASSTEHYSGSSYTDSFGNVHTVSAGGYQEQTELYTYTADGALAQVNLAYGGMSSDPNAIPHSTGAGTELASYVYDAMGRTTLYTEYQTGTSTAVYTRTAAYDADSNVTMDSVTTVRSDGTYIANTTYDYRLQTSDGAYDGAYMGVLTHSRTTNTGKAAPTSDTVNQYGWFDGAVISSTSLTPDVTQGGTNISTYGYDAAGHVIEVRIQDGQPRTIDLVNNAQGEVIKRDVVYDSGIAAPHELHYYVGGMAIGDVTNDGGGTSSTDYVTSIAEQMATPGNGAFQGGSEIANSYADFDQSYDPINGFDAASTQQSYTVAQGDSLQNIAQQLWGDASLWYLIADANGLSSSSVLTAGMMLTIPDKVTNFHNTSSTYQVYDPNAAIGDTSPNKQAPPQPAPVQPVGKHGGGCGVFGEIIEVVVAAVAAYFTFGAALGALGAASAATASLGELALAGAAAGAVGSVAAQGFGLATGMQKSFNWGGVAEGAIGGALGGALAGVSGLSGSGFLPSVERGIIGNVATQGIEVATGLEKSFDWAGVAASAVGSAAGWEVGSLIGYTPGAPVTNINNDLLGGVAGTAGAIASAATRSLINGSDFGGNIISALPGTIGQTIGNLVAGAIEGPQIEPVKVTPQAAQITPQPGVGGGQVGASNSAAASYLIRPDASGNITIPGSASGSSVILTSDSLGFTALPYGATTLSSRLAGNDDIDPVGEDGTVHITDNNGPSVTFWSLGDQVQHAEYDDASTGNIYQVFADSDGNLLGAAIPLAGSNTSITPTLSMSVGQYGGPDGVANIPVVGGILSQDAQAAQDFQFGDYGDAAKHFGIAFGETVGGEVGGWALKPALKLASPLLAPVVSRLLTNPVSERLIGGAEAEVGRAAFYVTSDGVAIPGTGYRAVTGEPAVNEALGGTIAPRPGGTYVTFNDITEMSPSEVKSLLQLPRTPDVVATFDTLPHVNSLAIPREYYGEGLFPEPLTISYPEFGTGGGTQAVTNLPINPTTVVPLRPGG